MADTRVQCGHLLISRAFSQNEIEMPEPGFDTAGSSQVGQADRLELAARAAWLYYIAGRTQDEIAAQLLVSRQSAQRLIARAVAEKLIRFRFDHPIGASMALSERLAGRFGLVRCTVVPHDPAVPDALPGIAVAGAQHLEALLAQAAPLVLGLSTGRTLRAIAAEVAPCRAPQHKVLSLCGTMSCAGRASSYEPVMRLAQATGAQCFPMPAPVVAASREELQLIRSQQAYRHLCALVAEARCLMVGVGHIGWMAPLHEGGFVTDAELGELIEAGAVGEIVGVAFDAAGRRVDTPVNDRVTGLPIQGRADAIRVGVAGGPRKVAPLRAALGAGLLNALITDEATAAAILGA